MLLGKERQIRLAVCCLISGGHLLIEDLPGMGKTTLATGLSSLLGLSFQRVQFTSDMLPADLIGMSVMNRESGKFEFRKGPVFTQVAVKTEKAARKLRWIRSEKIERLDAGLRKAEQDEYAAAFARVIQEITGDEE